MLCFLFYSTNKPTKINDEVQKCNVGPLKTFMLFIENIIGIINMTHSTHSPPMRKTKKKEKKNYEGYFVSVSAWNGIHGTDLS